MISVMLIGVLAASASGCVAEWGSREATSCVDRSGRDRCRSAKASSLAAKAGSLAAVSGLCLTVGSLPGRCGLRGLLSFQFIAFRSIEIVTPLEVALSGVSAASDSKIIVSSVGSPETDRGPPLS